MTRHLGLDLGGTNVKTAVLEARDDGFEVVARATDPTHAEHGPAAVVDRLAELARRAIADHGPVATVGVGVPGLFDRETGAIELFPNLPGPWPGHPLRDPIAEALGLPVELVNDARAFTLAESRVGAGRGYDTLVCVTLGTGIGGGVIVGGQLALGHWGKGGEVGHQVIVPDGPQCGCGNRGCVEPLTQAQALSLLAGRSDPAAVFAGVREGDPACIEAVQTVARHLAIGLANLVTVLGPKRIVVGGGIAEAGELILAPLREAIRARLTLVPAEELEVVQAELGPHAGAIGAAVAGAERRR